MILDCLLILSVYLPFVNLAHDHPTFMKSGIGLPWNTPRRDHNLDPTADLSLGETIAVVDPSEVKTLPQNTHVSARSMITGVSDTKVSGTESLPYLQTNSQTNSGRFPNARFEEVGRGLSSGISHTSKSNKLGGLELQGNGHIRDNSNDQVHHVTGQTITELAKIFKTNDQGLVNKNKADVRPANKFGEMLLQTIAKKVVSKLVDKIVNTINKENPGLTRSGNSKQGFADRRVVNQPFLPVAHSHGPHGEVIPVSRTDHVHSPGGHIIPVGMSWRQNPFLRPGIQRYPNGWI